MKTMIEQILGFTLPAEVPIELPEECVICEGGFEIIHKGKTEATVCCSRCGALHIIQLSGEFKSIVVEKPIGGLTPKFQTLFDEKFGFKNT